MGELAVGVLLTVLRKMLTAQLFSKLLVYGCFWISQRTDNTLDDKGCKALAEALGVEDYK